MGKFQTYNLDSFKQSLSWAFEAAPLVHDLKLAKALDYFNHGQLLSKIRDELPMGFLRAHSYLAADAFANFYKAAAVVVGDPSKDKDYQSRYKKIGLSRDFWKEKVEYVRNLRNDYGVAHYDLDSKQLDRELSTAQDVAKTIIAHYITFLQSTGD